MFERAGSGIDARILSNRPQSPLLFHVDEPAAGNPPRNRNAEAADLQRQIAERAARFGQQDATRTEVTGPSAEARPSFRAQGSAGGDGASRQGQETTTTTGDHRPAAAQNLPSVSEDSGRETGPSVESQAIPGVTGRQGRRRRIASWLRRHLDPRDRRN